MPKSATKIVPWDYFYLFLAIYAFNCAAVLLLLHLTSPLSYFVSF